MADDFLLYSYFRSSAAYRARIALNLKGIAPDYKFIHLLKQDQHRPDYKAVNPQEIIPTLVHDGHTIGQSLALIEYMDEVKPNPPLLPPDPAGRARVRQLAYAIACDIHPVNNLRVLLYLRDTLDADEDVRAQWQRHWIALGFGAIETLLQSPDTGHYCHGDMPSLADICLIPQLANARRVNLDLSPYPTILRIEETAQANPAFKAAAPSEQPDAE